MKALARWSKVWSLVGGALLSSSLFGATAVLALPDAQVEEKLRPIPVFAIADSQGAPLVAAPQQGENRPPVAGVFISQQDAQAFLNGLRTRQPQLAQGVQVVPVSLGEVYKMERAGRNQANRLEFALVPVQVQVNSALTLLRQGGQQVQEFNGVPLFYATGGQDNGYLTIQQGNQQVIPLFFKKEDLLVLLENFKKQQPALAASVNIRVVNLEGVIQTLQEKNDPQLNQIVFIPPRESLEYIQSLQQGGNPQQPPAQRRPAVSPSPAPSGGATR
jgi:nickel transport protein